MIEIAEIRRTGAWTLDQVADRVLVLSLSSEGPETGGPGTGGRLGRRLLQDLDSVLARLENEAELEILVVTGGTEESPAFPGDLSAAELLALRTQGQARELAELGQRVVTRLATLPATTVAALSGPVTGLSLELALGCDRIVAEDSSDLRVGLPVGRHGVSPAGGGSQRLPRRVGTHRAVSLLTRVDPIGAREALRISLVDRLAAPGSLLREAVRTGRAARPGNGEGSRTSRGMAERVRAGLDLLSPVRQVARLRARRGLRTSDGVGARAVLRTVDLVVDGRSIAIEDALRSEANLFAELAVLPEVRSALALEEDRLALTTAVPRIPDDVPAAVRAGDRAGAWTRRVAVLGAGREGGALAARLVGAGLRVRLADPDEERVGEALRTCDAWLDGAVARGLLPASRAENAREAILPGRELHAPGAPSVLVVARGDEAFTSREPRPDILSSPGEGGVVIVEGAEGSLESWRRHAPRPEQVVGLAIAPFPDSTGVAEVAWDEGSSEIAIATAEELARRLGKVPVRVRCGPGLLVARLSLRYVNEALRLQEEGFSPVEIDRVLREFGMPHGPFELLDEIGLPRAARLGRTIFEAHGERSRPAALLETLGSRVARPGVGASQGFYARSGRRPRARRSLVRAGLERGERFRPEERELWIRRLVLPVVDEAVRALAEGVVRSPRELDLAAVLGGLFPSSRGGPLRHADSVGLSRVVAELDGLREPRLCPGDELRRAADAGTRLHARAEEETGDESGATSQGGGA